MLYSRLRRHEDRKFKKRLIWALCGSIALVVFIFIFGLKLLVSFSLLIDKLHGATPVVKQGQVLILPPVLDPLPEATNSASLNITGRGDAGFTVIIYIDEEETKKFKIEDDGTFTLLTKRLAEGSHAISAKTTDDKGNLSDLSNVLTVSIKRAKPTLTINQPQDNARIVGDTNTIIVTGTSDPDASVTINGRMALVEDEGSFTYSFTLSEGENTIQVVAADPAGNQTDLTRRVTYQR